MTLNLTLFNRLPISDQVNDLVGDFTSTILLEVDASAKGSFEERARGLQRQLWEDLDHRYYSGIRVVRELARRRGPLAAAMPVVFTSTLNLERGEGGAARADQLGDLVYSITQTPQVWIDHQVFEEEGSLRFNWDAVEDLFPEGLLDSMFEAYCHFLENLAAEEDTWKARRSPLVPDEQLEQRDAVNSTAAPIPAIRLERLFLMQAETRPKHPAVISLVDSVTYGQLARRMAGVASWLRSEGAEPGRPVAIALEKGWEQPASVLGVLAAGAPYLPLDPDQPQARIDRILADGEVQHVLTTSSISRRVAWPTGVKVACVELLQPESPRSVALPPSTHNSALAYVLYTSGSTGSPKGVMVEHASVVNRILDVAQRLSIGPEDRTFGITALHHDLSVFDLFGSLCTGATMVLPGPTETRDPQAWTQLMEEHSVTLWNSVPAFLEMLVDFAERKARTSRAWRSLRHVLLAGDWIPVSLPNRVWQLNPETLFTSFGGPTETTVWDISFPVRSVDPDWESIPYGRPLTNSTYDVFDEELRPRPVWARGELFVGGACVARGYWNDPGRTAQRFLVHPKTGERLFRTGDLGRFLPSGDIEFLGRADRQVQIHGQRIELGEIEAALERHPSVRRGVVEAWESEFGRRRLAAYTVLRDGAELTLDGLRAHLAKEVPDSMVPRSLVVLESLPLSANGKVDRDQLPRPEETTEARGATESRPLPASSSRIGGLVAEVLGLAEVDPEGDLLDLGASSVDLVRISNRLDQEFAFRPSYEEFYSNPTIACLARALESSPGRKRDEVVDHRAVPANVDLILDPEEREAFKRRRLGLRRDSGLGETRPLESRLAGSEIAKRLASRRSHRRFELQPLKPEALSGLLVALRSVETDEGPRYLYPSAGGLYGVQVYLHCKRGRVSGLTAGTYYYDPNAHALRMLEPNAEIDGSVHTPFINRPAFEEAAFSLFLVAALDAIVPLYGDKALEFATLEAGYMGQLLMMEASEVDLGLCPIGSLDFERIRSHFRLGDSHRLVHSFVGGRPDSAGGQKKGEDRHAGGRQGRALRLLERVKDLDEEEAGRLLESLERDEPEDAG